MLRHLVLMLRRHPSSLFACGVFSGVVGLVLLRLRMQCRRKLQASMQASVLHVYELKGEYYQLLGAAWDHEAKDFKVVYRPLYNCTAKKDRFEAHSLAVSHYSRWESKFTRVDPSALPADVATLLLPGPFVYDPSWSFADTTSSYISCGPNRSGLGVRSHELPAGTRLLHENPRLRVLDLRLAAGAAPISAVHTHSTVRWQVRPARAPLQVCAAMPHLHACAGTTRPLADPRGGGADATATLPRRGRDRDRCSVGRHAVS